MLQGSCTCTHPINTACACLDAQELALAWPVRQSVLARVADHYSGLHLVECCECFLGVSQETSRWDRTQAFYFVDRDPIPEIYRSVLKSFYSIRNKNHLDISNLKYPKPGTPTDKDRDSLKPCESDSRAVEVHHAVRKSRSSSPSMLYKELSDKNRAIELLKRRLTNQQVQLGYYLHKNLATEAVLEFSNKCVPHLAEDSTHLSLAMYKFIRDSGGKTRLEQLREKLTEYNNRVHKVLLRQEQLIRQGFGFDKTFSPESGESEDEDKESAKKTYRTVKLELCSQLLGITLHVRKELEQFKICAENIVQLEEERNALVDRVFALPPEQRYGNLQVQVQAAVSEKKDSTASPSPSTTSVSTNTTMDVEDKKNHLSGALKDMEAEALQLLLLSEKQKNEFISALEKARDENQQLKERVRIMEEAASDDRVIYLQGKCNAIEREVDDLKRHLESEKNEKEQIMKQVATELESREIIEKDMKLEVKKLAASLEVIKSEKHFLQKQLNATKNQNTSTHEMICSSNNSQKDVEDLADLVVMQEEQIKDLLSIMSDLRTNDQNSSGDSSEIMHSPVQEESVAGDTLETLDVDTIVDDVIPAETKIINVEKSDEVETPESELADGDESDEERKEAGDEYQVYYDSTSEFTTNQEYSNDRASEHKDEQENVSKASRKSSSKLSIQKSRSSRVRSVTQKNFSKKVSRLNRYHDGQLATTSLRVQAFDKDGKSESMHAVLECSSPVDGLLEMNNASKLHLRLQCTSPQRPPYKDSRISSRTETTQDGSIPYSENHVAGDHPRNSRQPHMSVDAKIFLAEQLNKIKNQLETSSNVDIRRDIVENLNEIYSQLFDDDDMTDVTTRS